MRGTAREPNRIEWQVAYREARNRRNVKSAPPTAWAMLFEADARVRERACTGRVHLGYWRGAAAGGVNAYRAPRFALLTLRAAEEHCARDGEGAGMTAPKHTPTRREE